MRTFDPLLHSMGNYVSSCVLVGRLAGGHRKTIKVILPGGEVRRIDGAANAAELMLDAPGHFLVCSTSMKVGRRFSPLTADEDLEVGNVYAMLPMKRMNASVTEEDMAGLLMSTSKEFRREHGGRSSRSPEEKKPELDEMADDAALEAEAEADFQALKYMMKMRRSRLETIEEEP